MSAANIFIALYHFLRGRKTLLYGSLIAIVAVLAYMASGIKFSEDPTRFFPANEESDKAANLFSQISVKDKIIILFEKKSDGTNEVASELISVADKFDEKLNSEVGKTHIKERRLRVDENEIERSAAFIYDNLPVFLTESDYKRFDTITSRDKIDESLKARLALLLSPAGDVVSRYSGQDPLSMGTNLLARFDSLRMGMKFTVVNEHVFSSDLSTLLYVISPLYGSGESGKNEKLVKAIEELRKEFEAEVPGLKIHFMGGPSVGVYNARSIKSDTMITLSIALFVIVLVLGFAFKSVKTIILLIVPAAFGALFALAFMAGGDTGVSAIAIGAGATVMGIALSYSIHIISHLGHVKSIEQLLEELTYPLTIGSFTTIGAFAGLLFTKSELLRDFGLFSALTLVGTTLFSLIFLPHMLKIREHSGSEKFLRAIEKFSSQDFDKKRWLVSLISLLFVAGIIFSGKVKFESDMLKLSYEPKEHILAQERFTKQFGSDESRVLLLSTGANMDLAAENYKKCDSLLALYKEKGLVSKSASLSALLPAKSLQEERLQMWREYWGNGKREKLIKDLRESAELNGYAPDAFAKFEDVLTKNYSTIDFSSGELLLPPVFREWIQRGDSVEMLITHLFVNKENKEVLYKELSAQKDLVIIDRAHFSSLWAKGIKEDFNFILLLSSLLVFITLLISYGRLELALLAFIPMFVSWIIILGLMALFGISFNIVNILLATFIFGIGDDFSIFVLDGLSEEYSRRRDMLPAHKVAIFFSTFTVIVGMGAMIFAVHPALRSIAVVSVLGMAAVWSVAYTIQPIIYRYFITSQVRKGLPPFTLSGILLMLLTFSAFITGCIIASVLISLIALLPFKYEPKRILLRKLIRAISFVPVMLSPTVKIFRENPFNENFRKPAVIIANHQSFIDILMLLALYPKIVMMTNKWVWNSPFFGHIVRYAGFLYHKDGIENHIEELSKRVSQGYSVLIFPEGTRSPDLNIHRFHKGAFKIAEELSLDIIPILVYGNGNLVSKKQPFYVKHGVIGYRILERISPDNIQFGTDYRERGKKIAQYMRGEYSLLRFNHDTPQNHFFYYATLANFIYKGPVLEWYMRIKMKMEKSYAIFHNIIPKDACVTDLGCGYGPLSFMLGLLSPERKITGIDYDSDKIEIAQNCYAASERISFISGDVLRCEIPRSDVFVMNDILHYLHIKEQKELLKRVTELLNSGGFLIIRDGDSEKSEEHRLTKMTERFSIDILGFNKATHPPCFMGRSEMISYAAELNCKVETVRNDSYTSNTIYILRPINDGKR